MGIPLSLPIPLLFNSQTAFIYGMVFTKEELIEFRTLLSIGWTSTQIYEFRGENAMRGNKSGWYTVTCALFLRHPCASLL